MADYAQLKKETKTSEAEMTKSKKENVMEICGIIGGIATVMALTLGPMFYLGAKIDNFKDQMHEEMKDFHGRLCAIEERNKNK